MLQHNSSAQDARSRKSVMLKHNLHDRGAAELRAVIYCRLRSQRRAATIGSRGLREHWAINSPMAMQASIKSGVAAMTDVLDLHLASPAERAEAFRNFHDVWGTELGVEEHVHARLGSPKYKNAQWYVGCLQGRVVTACGCY